jgi:hypothetical protein
MNCVFISQKTEFFIVTAVNTSNLTDPEDPVSFPDYTEFSEK